MRSVLAQTKRFALLCHLALAPGGSVRRAVLLALFWPESDTARARNALNQAVHQLRRSLGEGVVVARGDELSVDPARLACDVVEFERALAERQTAAALALYRGELLPGLYLSDCPGWECWLDERRQQLRRKAAAAAWALADEARARGDASTAGRWAREAVALSPNDEAALRRLMQTLIEVGDEAGARSAYEAFTAALRQEHGAEPSAETRSLAATLQGAPTPDAPADRLSAAARPAPVFESPPIAERGPRRVRRGPVWATAAVLVMVAIAAFATPYARRPRAEPAAPPVAHRIAVLPFTVRGGQESGHLREAMAELLSAKLDGVGQLRTVPAYDVASFIQKHGVYGGPDERRALAERFHAGLYIVGSVIAAGERLQLSAALYEAGRDAEPVASTFVEGRGEDLLRLVDQLAAQLLAGRADPADLEFTRTALRTTESLPALAAYLDGQAHYRAGRYGEAVGGFQRAVAEDSAFALAYYGLAAAADWINDNAVLYPAARKAVEHRARLGHRLQRLLEGYHAFNLADAHRAEGIYREMLSDYPGDREAWFQLGEVHFHYNAVRGRSPSESRNAFARALAAEPKHAPSLLHLARLAAFEGRRAELDSLVRHLLHIEPNGERITEMRALRAHVLDDGAEEQRTFADLESGSEGLLAATSQSLAFAGELAGADRINRILTRPDRSAYWRARGLAMTSQLEVARGRWRAAEHAFDALAAIDPAWAPELRAMSVAVHLSPVPGAHRAEIRVALDRWDPVTARPVPSHAYGDAAPFLRLYLGGLLAASSPDSRTAFQLADALQALGGTPAHPTLGRTLAHSVRAHAFRSAGEPRRALAEIERFDFDPTSPLATLFFGRHMHERFLRAELLRELGRPHEALAWYASFPDPSAADVAYAAPAQLRQAQIQDQLGNASRAAWHYGRFAALWEGADAELQPLVRSAATRLAELRRAGVQPGTP